jgi:hypothetical protein
MSFVTVLLVVCLDLAVRGTCIQLPVTDTTQAQPDGHVVSIQGCMGLEGATTAIKYWDAHPDLREKFKFGGWACKIGNKRDPKSGDA